MVRPALTAFIRVIYGVASIRGPPVGPRRLISTFDSQAMETGPTRMLNTAATDTSVKIPVPTSSVGKKSCAGTSEFVGSRQIGNLFRPVAADALACEEDLASSGLDDVRPCGQRRSSPCLALCIGRLDFRAGACTGSGKGGRR